MNVRTERVRSVAEGTGWNKSRRDKTRSAEPSCGFLSVSRSSLTQLLLQKCALLVRPGADMKLNLSFVDQQDSYTVWALVGMIVSLQMCHSVCLRGSKTLLPAWENMADMYLGKKKKIPPSNSGCNYKIKIQCLRLFTNASARITCAHTWVWRSTFSPSRPPWSHRFCVLHSIREGQWATSEYL